MELTLTRKGPRQFMLERNGETVGAVWRPATNEGWCWALHGDEVPLQTGADETSAGACTDLVAAYWQHIDANTKFPETV